MMEKGFTCLVEITAVLSVLGLTFQVQGGAMIGEGNLLFCTLSFMRDDDQLLWRQRGLIQLMTSDLHLSVN